MAVAVQGAGRAVVRSRDLAVAVACAVLLLGVMLIESRAAPVLFVRLVLGLIVVLYLPGYCLLAVLAPRRQSLDQAERIGISIGVSVAIIPLLALLLDASPGGLRPWPVVMAETVWIVSCVLLALWQRSQQPPPSMRPAISQIPTRRWLGQLSGPERIVFPLVLIALVLAGGAALVTMLTPTADDLMTEMYVLGRGGLAEQLPRKVEVGEPVNVTLGIVNHELFSQRYRFEAWTVDSWNPGDREVLVAPSTLSVGPGEKIEWPLTWTMPRPGVDQMIELALYLNREEQPYRRLRLWVDVAPGAAGDTNAGESDLAGGVEANLAPPGDSGVRPTPAPPPSQHLPMSVPQPFAPGAGARSGQR
ncbi:MAG: DUF1616 domain-containing protein [Chloroflexi bacterium]|nr:DUF1616 domain-containing protein [Chloroflexota bacterium]